jgi:hypothetical protein
LTCANAVCANTTSDNKLASLTKYFLMFLICSGLDTSQM